MKAKKKFGVALFAALLLTVTITGAAALAPATSASSSGPSGMVALGDAQIDEDVPEGADVPIRAADLEGAVYASEHASSLEIVVTTPELASDHLGENANVIADDDVALVLSDDEVHEGRDVAVDVGVLEDGVGFVPSVAYGTHSSGEEWHSEIETTGGVAKWNVPEFSSNSVTFTGGITLSGDNAGDGTEYQYELDSLEGVDDYVIDLTGVENTAEISHPSTIADGGSETIDLAGDKEAENEEITLSADTSQQSRSESGSGGSSLSLSHGSDVVDITDTEVSTGNFESGGTDEFEEYDMSERIDNEPITKTWDLSDGYVEQVDIYIGDEYNTPGEVEVEVDGQYLGSVATEDGIAFAQVSGDPIAVSGSTDITVYAPETPEGSAIAWGEWNEHQTVTRVHYAETDSVTFSSPTDSTTIYSGYSSSSLDYEMGEDISVSVNGADTSYTAEYDEITGIKDISVSVGDSTVSHSGVLDGSTTETVDLSGESANIDASYGGESSGLSIDLSYDATTVTTDPVVEVNGYSTEHDGVLEDGETVSLATNDAWLREGTNNVTVTTSSPSSGPESLVGFDYAHDAAGTTQSVDVEATSWTETFNVSNTYPSSVEGAEARLTFSERVAEIDDLEVREDGGEWQSHADYSLEGTDLVVALGDVDADTELDVRATGHKVRAYDGEVRVTEPTIEGDELSTEVEIVDVSDEGRFGLGVDGTVLGDRIHYASDHSWAGAEAHAEVTASGTQIIRADDANAGSTMTVETAPLEVSPESGALEVVVDDPDGPRFSVREGDTVGTSSAEIVYHDTIPGDRYVLWSETRDREVDADRASSPVVFSAGGSDETYSIRQRDRAGSLEGGGAPLDSGGSDVPLLIVIPVVGLTVSGLWYAGRRAGATGVRGNAVLLVGSAVVLVVAAELVTPTSIAGSAMFAVGDAVGSGAGALLVSLSVLLGLVGLNRRFDFDVPNWILGFAAVSSAIMTLEAIRPGSVLGPIEESLAEVGALLALLAAVGVGALLWRRQRNQGGPDTEVTFELGEEGDD